MDRRLQEAADIIAMCKATCSELSISLPSILQDRYINKHSPLYWAIARKEKTSKAAQGPGVKSVNIFATLLPLALPITSELVISELREVCRVVSENKAFQRLRFDVPGFSKVEAYRSTSGKPRCDEVKIITWNHLYGNLFNVKMTFPDFSERLRARRTIGAEFVVRGGLSSFFLPGESLLALCLVLLILRSLHLRSDMEVPLRVSRPCLRTLQPALLDRTTDDRRLKPADVVQRVSCPCPPALVV